MKFSDLEPADRPEVVDLYVSVSRARLYDHEPAVIVLDAESWHGGMASGKKGRLVGFYCAGVDVSGQHMTSIVQQLENTPHPLDQSVFVRIRAKRVHVRIAVAEGGDLVTIDDVAWLDDKELGLDDGC